MARETGACQRRSFDNRLPELQRWNACRLFGSLRLSLTQPALPLPAGKLLGAFGAGWQVVLDRVAPSADMAEAALQPVLATVTRLGPGHGAPPVQLGFAPDAVVPNAEQVADICQVAAASPASVPATPAGGCHCVHICARASWTPFLPNAAVCMAVQCGRG